MLALAGRRILGIDFPRGRDFGPLLAAWLICIGVLVRGHDLGTSLLFFGLFVVLLYVATERVSWVIVGVVLFAGGAYVAYQIFGTVQTRVDGVAAPVRPGLRRRPATSCSSRCSGSAPAASSAPGWAAGTPSSSRCRRPTSSSPPSARRPACSASSACSCCSRCSSRAGFAAGLAVRDSFGKLLGLRAGVPHRAAAVRRRRRRHPAAARDRPDHAVPVLRRLVAAGQLGDPGAAGPGLRRRPAAGHHPAASAAPSAEAVPA